MTAVYIWERLKTVGPAVWDLLDLHLTAAEASLLLDQLHFLVSYSAQLRQAPQDGA
jgi:hypothetical protein